MEIDEALIAAAMGLADGADIHDVVGLVAMYRCLAREGDSKDIERELRSFVARKRMQQCDVLT